MKNYKILSIFTGAGGLDLGFHGDFIFLDKKFNKLSFKTVVSIDINEAATETQKFNKKYFKDTHILNEDIVKYDFNKIDDVGFDVLLGGFPCLSFSTQGRRLGIEDNLSGKLYLRYAAYLNKFKPKIFVAENVKGIISANKGEALKLITKKFEDSGYKVTVCLIKFADYGVPQKRDRVLFIGVRNDIQSDFKIPEKSQEIHITSSEAFKKINKDCENNELSKQSDKVRERINSIPEGGNFKDLPEGFKIKAMMSNIYRRLHRNEPAYTVTASGGGGTLSYHYSEPRALTNRERARLQGFPDDFVFKGSKSEVRRQIGNAVPPVGIYPFAKSIESLLKTI